nr:MAG TPA: hypothetical protein [Bacteriophage sp.]
MPFCPSSAYFFGLLICYNSGLSISVSSGVLFFFQWLIVQLILPEAAHQTPL